MAAGKLIDWQPVLLAAGRSARFGETNKLLEHIEGVPAVLRSLRTLTAVPSQHPVIAVVSPETQEMLMAWVQAEGTSELIFVQGGERRRDSVRAGLRRAAAEYVAIHDAARPLATPDLLRRVLDAATGHPGAVPTIAIADTIGAVDEGKLLSHVSRESVQALQTPQVVRTADWLRAAEQDEGDVTDDTAMIGRLGLHCVVVRGESTNIKLTTRTDLLVLKALAAAEDDLCTE